MREFFKGWRRKAGCFTLVIAFALACLWVRGVVAPKSVMFQIGQRNHWIETNNGRLVWGAADIVEGLLEDQRDMTKFVNENYAPPKEGERRIFLHWPVLCLTLLSAYLILWKPRKSKSPNPTF